MSSSKDQLEELQQQLEYNFSNPFLLLRALTHRSYIFEHPDLPREDNETLEFLGDAALDLAIGSLLFNKYPAMNEGDLTKLRSSLVQGPYLSLVANKICLGTFLLLGKGEEKNGGRTKGSILACAYEAVIGALYADGGFDTVQKVVGKHFSGHVDKAKNITMLTDAKSRIQELTQQYYNETPSYILDKAEGPDHEKTFTISVHFRGSILASASAKSKKNAEQKAAEKAINKLMQDTNIKS